MHYSTHDLSDTIVALATPPGVGAIGVIRVAGTQARSLVGGVFAGKDLTLQPTHTAHYGSIRTEDGRLLDEVLATVFVAPQSYTGEDAVEIGCHGSPYIIQEIIQLLVRRGARLARPGEFTLRAFLHGKLDLSQAEAVADLIASGSAAQHALALRQLRGGFRQEIEGLRQELIDFAALIELELDFGEEDVEFADRDRLRELVERIQRTIARLTDSFALGNAIREGVSTVIAGRPNAGKSTLLNALLNEERAIVSEVAGTTRDTIEEVLNVRGIPFRLIDTAGIREASDQIEAIGVARALEKVAESAILIYVFDVIEMQPEAVQADLAKLARPGLPVLVVANKMDRNPHTRWEHYFADAPATVTVTPEQWIPMVAREGMNLSLLLDRLYTTIIEGGMSTESTVVTNARHYAALRAAHTALAAVLDGLSGGTTADLVALDIRRALHHLGEITGQISTDDLLDSIFTRFCIGK